MSEAPDSVTILDQDATPTEVEHAGKLLTSKFYPASMLADQHGNIDSPDTGTASNVASSATSVTVLAANVLRKQAIIYNDSIEVLYVKFGTTASTSSFTVPILPGGMCFLPICENNKVYNGRIDGIWASANGFARVTEIT